MKLRDIDHDGRARFVTFCTHRRIPILTSNEFRRILVRAMNAARKEHGFKLLAYVIMPEHVHLVLVPRIGSRLGQIIGEIKSRSSREIHDCLANTNSPLLRQFAVVRNGVEKFACWQRRCYDHNCRTDASLREKVEYCHNNPVIRGLTPTAEDWRWSSCAWYQGERDVELEIDAWC